MVGGFCVVCTVQFCGRLQCDDRVPRANRHVTYAASNTRSLFSTPPSTSGHDKHYRQRVARLIIRVSSIPNYAGKRIHALLVLHLGLAYVSAGARLRKGLISACDGHRSIVE